MINGSNNADEELVAVKILRQINDHWGRDDWDKNPEVLTTINAAQDFPILEGLSIGEIIGLTKPCADLLVKIGFAEYETSIQEAEALLDQALTSCRCDEPPIFVDILGELRSGEASEPMAKQKLLAEELAEKPNDVSRRIMFEGCNESECKAFDLEGALLLIPKCRYLKRFSSQLEAIAMKLPFERFAWIEETEAVRQLKCDKDSFRKSRSGGIAIEDRSFCIDKASRPWRFADGKWWLLSCALSRKVPMRTRPKNRPGCAPKK